MINSIDAYLFPDARLNEKLDIKYDQELTDMMWVFIKNTAPLFYNYWFNKVYAPLRKSNTIEVMMKFLENVLETQELNNLVAVVLDKTYESLDTVKIGFGLKENIELKVFEGYLLTKFGTNALK